MQTGQRETKIWEKILNNYGYSNSNSFSSILCNGRVDIYRLNEYYPNDFMVFDRI